MRFASAMSELPDTAAAVEEVCQQVREGLGRGADLAVCFVPPHHGPDFAPMLEQVREALGARTLIGCTGEAIVGRGREVEGTPALSVWGACLPGATIQPMRLEFERTPEGGVFTGWPSDLPAAWPTGSALIALGEPFTFPADALLKRLNEDQPGIPVLGGMASGAQRPGQNQVFLNGTAYDSGAVAVLLHGDFAIRSVVSQGCRPIGRPLVITKSEREVIFELSGRPALAVFQEVFDGLSAAEQELVQNGLHVGRVINEQQAAFTRGDFLVRNCIGADRTSGAIAIGDLVRTGQTVQFHVRDAVSADEDLRELLSAARPAIDAGSAGALLFTCNGRGTRLFPEPNHDAAALRDVLGDIPVAGFFAMGEMGPIGGRNFLHGFTASVALFTPKAPT
ncbi:MAG: FIST C-terminal domain-containing protein [Planctomycetes bacterium]|nr:FIST C-terminal domain-containing protein [Planctomycetota bacterium]